MNAWHLVAMGFGVVVLAKVVQGAIKKFLPSLQF